MARRDWAPYHQAILAGTLQGEIPPPVNGRGRGSTSRLACGARAWERPSPTRQAHAGCCRRYRSSACACCARPVLRPPTARASRRSTRRCGQAALRRPRSIWRVASVPRWSLAAGCRALSGGGVCAGSARPAAGRARGRAAGLHPGAARLRSGHGDPRDPRGDARRDRRARTRRSGLHAAHHPGTRLVGGLGWWALGRGALELDASTRGARRTSPRRLATRSPRTPRPPPSAGSSSAILMCTALRISTQPWRGSSKRCCYARTRSDGRGR